MVGELEDVRGEENTVINIYNNNYYDNNDND